MPEVDCQSLTPIEIRVEVMNVETNGQRRFTVVELPVFPIVKESLLMPLNFLPELVKFGWIPFTAMLAIDLICFGLRREDASRSVTGGLMTISHFVLFTPFSVAWTKLAIRGRPAVAKHPQFSYSRTQWLYLLADGVMMAALLVLVFMPYAIFLYGHQNFDNSDHAVRSSSCDAGTWHLRNRVRQAGIRFSCDCDRQVRWLARGVEANGGKL